MTSMDTERSTSPGAIFFLLSRQQIEEVVRVLDLKINISCIFINVVISAYHYIIYKDVGILISMLFLLHSVCGVDKAKKIGCHDTR